MGNLPFKVRRSASSKKIIRRAGHRWEGYPVAEESHTNTDISQEYKLLDSSREALIPTLKEFQRRLEYLATYLEDLEQEALALRSASKHIKYVVERLTSSKEAAKARTSGH
jgi:hypothetical protein